MEGILAFAERFPAGWLAALALAGLMVGSFLNVVIYRLPIMLERRWHWDACAQLGLPLPVDEPHYNLWWPPSGCPHCQHAIAIKDNIPIVSWLWLRGRSRCCQRPISTQYPLIEVLTMLFFMSAGLLWPPGMALWGALILLSFLLVLTVIDMKTWLLPDALTLPLLWLGLMFNLSGTFVSLDDAVIGAIAGYLSLWLLYWGFILLTGKDALGYGDFKLLAALGGWLGWRALPNLMLIAALSGLIATLAWRWVRRKKTDQPLAFGPWLAVGGGISILINGIGV
ncbi:general secretion pathway protein O|uniref:Prepilin leader peptidase/N-methyltransferase n=1 Tax=Brenneria salicis ATCC 15712 = DSM 30166 TaxID=714314 RepID=A0A366I978_9GAMM|nr:A24 family peptidase [Brenneria salicis]NMN91008.1 general secretion pathway protein O [Brenneria salicis ATCC 15712 = DSM 30166]RBP66502.1 type 4 prepilin peptidase 1 [Brenneria salicis ATCC 15712 = DSM 30166]RLM32046.1 prepilin peptidase [Brenneria salicis ATCC 15712 = DSM 30166]